MEEKKKKDEEEAKKKLDLLKAEAELALKK